MRTRKLRKIALLLGIFLPVILLLVERLTDKDCLRAGLLDDGTYTTFIYNNAPFIDYFIAAFISGLLLLFYFYTSEKNKSAVGLRGFLYFFRHLFYVILIEAGIFSLIFGLSFSLCLSF